MPIKKPALKNLGLKHFSRTALLAASLLCASLPAFAQPDPNEQAIGDNPAIAAGVDWQRMTPEQRYAMQRQFLDPMLRNILKAMNYPEVALQDAIIASAIEQEIILDDVRAKHRAVTAALIRNVATDEQLLALMTDLQASVETAKTRRRASVAALDEKIHFSEQPRLAAVLSLSGITGEESAYIGGVMGSFNTAMTNMGEMPPAAPQGEALR